MKMKKLLKAVLIAAMSISLSACDSAEIGTQSLITGSIDSDIKGIITKAYIENSGWSKTEHEVERKECITILAEGTNNLYSVLGIETAMITNQIVPLYEKLLEKFEYEVVEVVEETDTSATIMIKYRPFLLGEQLDEIAYPFYESLPEQGDMSDTAYLTKYDGALFAELLNTLEAFVETPVLGDEITMELSVYTTDDEWSLSDNYYEDFFWSIIDLNL